MRKVSEVVYQIYELEKQKKKVIDLFTACYIYVYVNINVYFLQKKERKKERNTFRILSIRVPWTSTTKHGDANLFVSFDILRYLHGNTQCKHVSTPTVPS